MKISFTGKIRLLILLIFIIVLIQAGVVLHLLGNSIDLIQMRIDIQNTIFITIFVQFILALILIFYIPVFLHKAFLEIHNIIKDISQGIYNIDIDTDNFKRSLDKEFYTVMLSLKDMLRSILSFDKLKKDKIVEHHNRIVSLLNLTDDGFIIMDMKANIAYINDKILEAFPALSEKTNMIETNFPPEIENNIKKYVLNILKSKTKQESQQFFVPSMKRHIALNSAIIRDSNGFPTGVIVSFKNLDKKKQEKQKETESE